MSDSAMKRTLTSNEKSQDWFISQYPSPLISLRVVLDQTRDL